MTGLLPTGVYDEATPGFKQVKGLSQLCKGFLVLDPTQRLGVKGNGFADIKKEPFFKGLDWAKLEAGVLQPPIEPPKSKINAQLPSSLKDEFQEWADKPIPDDAHTVYAEWTVTCRP
eukprot:5144887-Prymnesium_polylepis.1